MESWDIRLLTGSYSIESNEDGREVVVELYGKTKDGKSAVIRYSGFKPYFHVVGEKEEVDEVLEGDNEVLKTEELTLFTDGKDRTCTRVTIRIPRDVPQYRNKFHSKGFTVLAADIPFAHRFIYDLDLGACVRVQGEEIKVVVGNKYTTDLVIKANRFEECEPFVPPLKILSFDIENSIKDGTIYTICCAIRAQGVIHQERLTGNEKEIIKRWVEVVQSYDPDVITGYNIEGYDLPIILERAKKHKLGSLKLGRDLLEPRNVSGRFWRLHGRIIADAWWAVKKELKPKKETLGYIAGMMLNEKKHDVDPKRIEEEWESDSSKVISYCYKDAELALRILEKIAVLEKSMDLAIVSKLPVDDIINGSSSIYIDSILIREADRNKIGVPLTHHKRKDRKIEGGYVHSINPGLYHWVCVLDFKSMYPSIIISNNICFTTLNEKGGIESPISVKFLTPENRRGILPKILEDMMIAREDALAKMRKAKAKDEKRYYDGLQAAIKILMNSVYGVFASAFYRFTEPSIGASITAFARESIKNVINKLEDEGITVIYSDTDSVFIQSPYEELEATKQFGNDISERFSQKGTKLEFEKMLEPLFSHGKKKRYVGKVVWPEEDIIVRGYETRRTDAFDLQSEALYQTFEKILSDNIEDAVKTARNTVTDILNGKVPIEKLVISRTCKPETSYKNPDSMVNVQIAKKLVGMGYEFVPGMKVSWIVTNSKQTPQGAEPYIDGREFEHRPDWEYYAKRVAMTLARVTDVFGWDEKSLLVGAQQKSLFSDSFKGGGKEPTKDKRGEESGKTKSKGPKKTDKELTLEDFL